MSVISCQSFATGIPVFCYNCQEATYNAAHTIADAIRLQTEAQVNAMDYVMRTTSGFNVATANAKGVTEQRIANAYKMDPSIAKPRLACAQASTASVRGGAAGGASQLRQTLQSKTQENNMRGANLAKGESRKEYSVNKLIVDLGADDVDPAEVTMSQSPIPNDAAAIEKHQRIKNATLNPFPVELPTQPEISRIKTNGSQGEREGLAQSLAMNARQSSAQSVLDEDEANRIQIVKADPLYNQLLYMTESMDADTKALWSTGKLSAYQVEELSANYRANSPTWIKQISAGASSDAIMKEIALEMAELLKQTNMTNHLLRQGNILSALRESREVSGSGLISK
jgi:hypothetical protein